MVSTELMRYYFDFLFVKDPLFLKDDLLKNELKNFHDENKDLSSEEYVKKLEDRFGHLLKHVHRISESNLLKNISASLMWVRVFVILSLISGIIYALVLLFS